jgi:peptidoglycan/LPS O-acetylase OafA/YrhL
MTAPQIMSQAMPQNIKPLTSMRFFAALWVVFYHYWPKLVGAAPSAFIERGYLGVELFFVLSGFILCHVYLPQTEAGKFKYGSFLWARIARVYPLHLVTLIAVAAMGLGAVALGGQIDSSVLSWRSLPANLLMLQAWGLAPDAAFNHPSWSISAEWFAYLSFPVFAAATLALKSKPWMAALAAALLLILLYAVFPLFAGHPLTQATIAWGALRIVPCFALGCAAWLVWRSEPIRTPTLALAACAALVAGIVAMAALGAADTVIVLAFAGLIVALASLTSTGSKIGTSKPAVWLGEVSYAVYMVCIPWELLYTNVLKKGLGIEGPLPWYLWLGLLVGVVPVAALAHHLVELPARKLMRRRVSPSMRATVQVA